MKEDAVFLLPESLNQWPNPALANEDFCGILPHSDRATGFLVRL